MKTPDFLKHGDTIAFISTARKATKEELRDAEKLVKHWGFKVKYGKTIDAEHHQFAGDDDLRAEDFQNQLDDPEVKAIWCARGGYGTVRIIDRIDFSRFAEKPKWILGYSDMTILHLHLNALGVDSMHAQTAVSIAKNTQETSESIRRVLFGEPYFIEIENTSPLGRLGSAEGEVVGGNLSILYSTCGSRSCPDTKGKILFLEDLDEYLYHVDRMMINLKRNGMLDDLAGLIVGGLTDMHDNAVPFGKTAEEIVMDAVKEYDYPVCFNFPAGHIEDNRTLILGRKAKLEVQEKRIQLFY